MAKQVKSTRHVATPLTYALLTQPLQEQNFPDDEHRFVVAPQSGKEVPPTSTYAGIWRRTAAWVADVLLFFGALGFVLTVLVAMGYRDFPLLYAMIGWWAYIVVATSYGATVGKRAASIKVVDISGSPPGFQKSFVRSILPVMIVCAVVLAAGNPDLIPEVGEARAGLKISPLVLILVGVWIVDHLKMTRNTSRQTWHDKMAGTYVIRR